VKEDNFLKNVMKVMFGNTTLLISQILTGFVLPKLMSVESFGNYRIFMLYGTYAGLLHFGFVDGILFRYGGKNIEDIDSHDISKNFSFFLAIEAITSITIILISLAFFSGNKYGFIFLSIGMYSFVLNIVTFFQYFSQAILRFSLVASASIVQATLISFVIIIILVAKSLGIISNVNYQVYIIIYICIYCMLLVFYSFNYVSNSQYNKLLVTSRYGIKGVGEIFKIGLPITIAYQISNLTLNLDNQFVSLFFSSKTFAKYSFAYNLVSITISVILAVATVLFPYLNKRGKEESLKKYAVSIDYMLLFVYASLISYYPVKTIIQFFLPKYQESIIYFRILSPGVAITLCITVIVSNYYKVMDDNIKYLKNGCISLVITFFLDIVAYLIFKDVIIMAVISLVELAIWYGIEDISFRKKYGIEESKSYLYIVLMVVVFELVTAIHNVFISISFYMCLYLLISFVIMKKPFISLLQKVSGIISDRLNYRK
jgi:O-antigen/teichoic acid export membrane protein